MKILLEDNLELNTIWKYIINKVKGNKYLITNDLNGNLADVICIECNERECINVIKNKKVNILVLTKNGDKKFLWNLINEIHPLDIINIANSKESIKERFESNLRMLKEKANEKGVN